MEICKLSGWLFGKFDKGDIEKWAIEYIILSMKKIA